VSDLVEFLRARIDEDEAAARREQDEVAERILAQGDDGAVTEEWSRTHILHPGADWPCPTLRAFAAVYAGHPDYRPEWAA